MAITVGLVYVDKARCGKVRRAYGLARTWPVPACCAINRAVCTRLKPVIRAT